MPLYGKIVVIKRSGLDGTHFPLTSTSCLFGRKTECDIRIQLPHVSKEHCRIEVNENKEVVATNLSVVNPTLLNGVCLEQPTVLADGDELTVIDRSFRFEYPPRPTPKKKRNSTTLQNEALQVSEVEPLRAQRQGISSRGSDNGSEKNSEENGTESIPTKQRTSTKNTTRRSKSFKGNDQSPFSELYEMLKHRIDAKPKQQDDEKGKTCNGRADGDAVQETPASRPRSKRKSQLIADSVLSEAYSPSDTVLGDVSLDFSDLSEVRVSARSPLRSRLHVVEKDDSNKYTDLDATPKVGPRDVLGGRISSANMKVLEFSDRRLQGKASDLGKAGSKALSSQSSPKVISTSTVEESKTIKRLSQGRSFSAQQLVHEIQEEMFSQNNAAFSKLGKSSLFELTDLVKPFAGKETPRDEKVTGTPRRGRPSLVKVSKSSLLETNYERRSMSLDSKKRLTPAKRRGRSIGPTKELLSTSPSHEGKNIREDSSLLKQSVETVEIVNQLEKRRASRMAQISKSPDVPYNRNSRRSSSLGKETVEGLEKPVKVKTPERAEERASPKVTGRPSIGKTDKSHSVSSSLASPTEAKNHIASEAYEMTEQMSAQNLSGRGGIDGSTQSPLVLSGRRKYSRSVSLGKEVVKDIVSKSPQTNLSPTSKSSSVSPRNLRNMDSPSTQPAPAQLSVERSPPKGRRSMAKSPKQPSAFPHQDLSLSEHSEATLPEQSGKQESPSSQRGRPRKSGKPKSPSPQKGRPSAGATPTTPSVSPRRTSRGRASFRRSEVLNVAQHKSTQKALKRSSLPLLSAAANLSELHPTPQPKLKGTTPAVKEQRSPVTSPRRGSSGSNSSIKARSSLPLDKSSPVQMLYTSTPSAAKGGVSPRRAKSPITVISPLTKETSPKLFPGTKLNKRSASLATSSSKQVKLVRSRSSSAPALEQETVASQRGSRSMTPKLNVQSPRQTSESEEKSAYERKLPVSPRSRPLRVETPKSTSISPRSNASPSSRNSSPNKSQNLTSTQLLTSYSKVSPRRSRSLVLVTPEKPKLQMTPAIQRGRKSVNKTPESVSPALERDPRKSPGKITSPIQAPPENSSPTRRGRPSKSPASPRTSAHSRDNTLESSLSEQKYSSARRSGSGTADTPKSLGVSPTSVSSPRKSPTSLPSTQIMSPVRSARSAQKSGRPSTAQTPKSVTSSSPEKASFETPSPSPLRSRLSSVSPTRDRSTPSSPKQKRRTPQRSRLSASGQVIEEVAAKSPARSPKTSPARSPKTSPARSPKTSPARSPKTSPARSPMTSPARSPMTSPARSPKTSPARSPKTSPARSPARSPKTSPARSPKTSPARSPRTSPARSPRTSPARSPRTSPARSPRTSPARSPRTSPARSPRTSPARSPRTSPARSPRTSPARSPRTSPARSPRTSPARSPRTSPARSPRTSPRRMSGKVRAEEAKKSPRKRSSGELDALTEPPMKRKRVSFGGHLSPELFDKRLPPNSPLRRGATPARLSLSFTPRAVMRKSFSMRHAVIKERADKRSPPSSPSKKSRSTPAASPVAKSPAKKSQATSPVARSPAKKSPVASPVARSPAKKSPVASPVARSPATSPVGRSPSKRSPATSPVGRSPAKKSPVASPVARSPAKKSPVASPVARSPAKKSPVASPVARSPSKRSPAVSPVGRSPSKRSPAVSPVGRSPSKRSPAVSPVGRSPAVSPVGRSPSKRSPAVSPVGRSPSKRSPAVSPVGRSPSKRSPAVSPVGRSPSKRSPAVSPVGRSPAVSPVGRSPAVSPVGRSPSKRSPAGRSPAVSPVGRSPAKRSPAVSPVGRSLAKRSPAVSPVGRSPAVWPVDRSPAKRSPTVSPVGRSPAVSPVGRSPAKRSPAVSPVGRSPAKRSPAVSPLSRSPAVSPVGRSPAKRSLAASPAVRSAAKSTPTTKSSSATSTDASHLVLSSSAAILDFSPTPNKKKGRFSVSHISTPPLASNDLATEGSGKIKSAAVKTPETIQKSATKTPRKSMVSSKAPPSRRKSRSNAVEAIRSRRKSGATEANLLVAKSWADIVKHGVAKPQVENVKKRGGKVKEVKKKVTKAKTPARTVKHHFSTGHADSPATIVIGRAHSRTVQRTGEVPRVVRNFAVVHKVDANESFTGMAEMFRTPQNEKRRRTLRLSTPARTASVDMSVMVTPEESGEMVVSPLSSRPSTLKIKQISKEAVSRFLNVPETPSSTQKRSPKAKTPVLGHAEDTYRKSPGAKLSAKKEQIAKTKKTKENLTGLKRLLKTPKQRGKLVLDSVALKLMLKTPKLKRQSVIEALSVSPTTRANRKEHTDDLVGIKRLLRTPKQKGSQVLDLIGVSRIMKTPKQKAKPVESKLGIRQMMRTPKEYVAIVKKTPKVKGQAVEDMVGLRRMMNTPKTKIQPVEDLFGIERLMASPKQKGSPVRDMKGIKQLLKTPKGWVKPVRKQSTRSKARHSASELNYSGIQEMFETPKESKAKPTKDTTEGETSSRKDETLSSSSTRRTSRIQEFRAIVQESSSPLLVNKSPRSPRKAKVPDADSELIESAVAVKHLRSFKGETPISEEVNVQEASSDASKSAPTPSKRGRAHRGPSDTIPVQATILEDKTLQHKGEGTTSTKGTVKKPVEKAVKRASIKAAVALPSKTTARSARSARNTGVVLYSELVQVIPLTMRATRKTAHQQGKAMESVTSENTPLLQLPIALLEKVSKKPALKRSGRGKLAPKPSRGRVASASVSSGSPVKGVQEKDVADERMPNVTPVKPVRGKKVSVELKTAPVDPGDKRSVSPTVKETKRSNRSRNESLIVEHNESGANLPRGRSRKTVAPSGSPVKGVLEKDGAADEIMPNVTPVKLGRGKRVSLELKTAPVEPGDKRSVSPTVKESKRSTRSRNETLVAEHIESGARGRSRKTVAPSGSPVKGVLEKDLAADDIMPNVTPVKLGRGKKISVELKTAPVEPGDKRSVSPTVKESKRSTRSRNESLVVEHIESGANLARGRSRKTAAPSGSPVQRVLEDVAADEIMPNVTPVKLGRGKKVSVELKIASGDKRSVSPTVKESKRATRSRNEFLVVEHIESSANLPRGRSRETAATSEKAPEKVVPKSPVLERKLSRDQQGKTKKSVQWHPMVADVKLPDLQSSQDSDIEVATNLKVTKGKHKLEAAEPAIPAKRTRGSKARTKSLKDINLSKRSKTAQSLLIEVQQSSVSKTATRQVLLVQETVTVTSSPRRGRRKDVEVLSTTTSASETPSIATTQVETFETTVSELHPVRGKAVQGKESKRASMTSPAKNMTESSNIIDTTSSKFPIRSRGSRGKPAKRDQSKSPASKNVRSKTEIFANIPEKSVFSPQNSRKKKLVVSSEFGHSEVSSIEEQVTVAEHTFAQMREAGRRKQVKPVAKKSPSKGTSSLEFALKKQSAVDGELDISINSAVPRLRHGRTKLLTNHFAVESKETDSQVVITKTHLDNQIKVSTEMSPKKSKKPSRKTNVSFTDTDSAVLIKDPTEFSPSTSRRGMLRTSGLDEKDGAEGHKVIKKASPLKKATKNTTRATRRRGQPAESLPDLLENVDTLKRKLTSEDVVHLLVGDSPNKIEASPKKVISPKQPIQRGSRRAQAPKNASKLESHAPASIPEPTLEDAKKMGRGKARTDDHQKESTPAKVLPARREKTKAVNDQYENVPKKAKMEIVHETTRSTRGMGKRSSDTADGSLQPAGVTSRKTRAKTKK